MKTTALYNKVIILFNDAVMALTVHGFSVKHKISNMLTWSTVIADTVAKRTAIDHIRRVTV